MKKKENKHLNQQNSDYLYGQSPSLRFFVTTAKGFEDTLQEELSELYDFLKIKHHSWKGSAGCYVESPWSGAVSANLASMCASRVLLVLLERQIDSEEDIYHACREISWTDLFEKQKTFAVNASINHTFIDNSMFLALKIKDALCDNFRDDFGSRPNVDTENPDVKIFVRLVQNKLSISIDTTGEPLSQRGYRTKTVEAPLKETLAASLLRITGWNKLANSIWNSSEGVNFEDKETRILKKQGIKVKEHLLSPFLLDPMCGSGTFAIEAALALLHWKPNAHRTHFAFFNILPELERELKSLAKEIRNKILANEKSITNLILVIRNYAKENNIEFDENTVYSIIASDISENNLETAKECAKNAGVNKIITFKKQNAFMSKPHASVGLCLVNPPYGERLNENTDLEPFYKSLGDLWKQEFPNWTSWLISGNEEVAKKVGLKPTRKITVYNGSIPCKFFQYVLYPRNSKNSNPTN
ncbi:THUMP domain-containing protein [Pigmentibacter sp. JX0631]|uniref:THUMP domain-containing class I SAM-dependent RNA methyltransferase n=1 Tax=Pigmentibacter sp. JX0631 TaxID=2976982 RepID=UPI0024691691|nr:THUMP domain-containing protein [Pigmentibacter sp. JX0631]WGL59457.1 THUMP domain-containing protein [Pigmentibacter sp. JX0631]